FRLKDGKLDFADYYKMPAAQSEAENCVAHNGSLVPVPGRDIKVQAWHQGGRSAMDFTDPENPVEIAYFARGPIDPKMLIMGGHWSAYWYNCYVYGSEIAQGLDIFELTPNKDLTQNEIDASKTVRLDVLNVQTQERMEWPNKLVVAKAYLDQLERNKAMEPARVAAIRKAVQSAERSKLNKSNRTKLKALSAEIASAAATASGDDAARMQALAEVLDNPVL